MAISERRKVLWRFVVSEETMKAADFQPEQYTLCKDGHTVQGLVFTHETAKEVELDPYCVTALLPLRRLFFLWRGGEAGTASNRRQGSLWWQGRGGQRLD